MRALHPIDGAEEHKDRRKPYARVIVRKDKLTELQNGVVVLERHQRQHHDGQTTPWRATVVASGSPDMRAGDRVLIERYAGTDILHDGERLTILPASEVLAVLED
jgi:co-chaperonin GroES (HSP10)